MILKNSLEWGGFNRSTPAKGFIFKDYIHQSRFTLNELPNVNLRAPSLTPRLLSSKGNVFHFRSTAVNLGLNALVRHYLTKNEIGGHPYCANPYRMKGLWRGEEY